MTVEGFWGLNLKWVYSYPDDVAMIESSIVFITDTHDHKHCYFYGHDDENSHDLSPKTLNPKTLNPKALLEAEECSGRSMNLKAGPAMVYDSRFRDFLGFGFRV